VTASAGAGKTHALTHRYTQFLLTNRIPHTSLRSILAITFTNNAAVEMKQRILTLLKELSLGNPSEVKAMTALLSVDPATLPQRAEDMLNLLLENYSDFQVKTIDSFMSSVFLCSSLDLGYHPGFEIVLDADVLIDETAAEFARSIRTGNPIAQTMVELTGRLIGEKKGTDKFPWNPYAAILEKIKKFYADLDVPPEIIDATDLEPEIDLLKSELSADAGAILADVEAVGLDINANIKKDLIRFAAGDWSKVVDNAFKKEILKKSAKTGVSAAAAKIADRIKETYDGTLLPGLANLVLMLSRSHFRPDIRALQLFGEALEKIKKRKSQILLNDVGRTMAGYLTAQVIPDIYFKLGEAIHHYLIDEFQDTSPVQWKNLYPLIENSLAAEGTLFVVGDTKQSIYSFRGADWKIMKHLQKPDAFPSAACDPQTLGTNYRSYEQILKFNQKLFKENIAVDPLYGPAAEASGLSNYVEEVKPEHRDKGYVEALLFVEDDVLIPEKAKIVQTVEDCLQRGYHPRDIAILTPRNKDVIAIGAWLNERNIAFISHSSLDVRKRKITGELISLLKFLESPVDDLSLASFLVGGVFAKYAATTNTPMKAGEIYDLIHRQAQRRDKRLYVLFRIAFPEIWAACFEHLYAVVGYMPLYDLVCEMLVTFKVFATHPEEEASLVTLLEAVKEFEQTGMNTLRNFIEYTGQENDAGAWKIDVPASAEAVQVLTVHKAKGLGFPVVIVVLHDHYIKTDNWALVDNGQGDGRMEILHLNSSYAEKSDLLKKLYEAARFKETVDELNQLYVALTRAREEMYVIGLYKKEPKYPTKYIPVGDFPARARPAVSRPAPEPRQELKAFYSERRRAIPVQESNRLASREVRRGDVVHAVLSRLEFIDSGFEDSLSVSIADAKNELHYDGDVAELNQVILSFLAADGIGEFFERRPGRMVLNEQEFASKTGALFRADRIVIDPNVMTVIDFKTGGDEAQAKYIPQVQQYMGMTGEIFPGKPVQGYLAYVDLKELRRVQ